MSQQGQESEMDTITEEDVAASKGYESLGPAYFASRRIVERFMASFEAEHFKPLIDKAAKDFRPRRCKMQGDPPRELMIADAKLIPFSSVVGQSIALLDDTGRVIGQLAILNLPAGTDYRAGSQAIGQQIINAIRGTS